jgi:hypothetical protein
VRVGELGDCLGFALQPMAKIRVGRKIGRKDLDSYVAFESGVASAIHLSHSAGAERGEDFVWSELHSSREGHVCAQL